MRATFDAMEMVEQTLAGAMTGVALARGFDLVAPDINEQDLFQVSASLAARLALNGAVLGSIVDYASESGRDWKNSSLGAAVFVVFAMASQPMLVFSIDRLAHTAVNALTNVFHEAENDIGLGGSSAQQDGQLQGPSARQLDTAGETFFSKASDPNVDHFDL